MKVERHTGTDGWLYEIYPKDTPADELELDGFVRFKQLWDSKRVGDAIPAWRDYELADFADWYGWISVEDIIPGPDYDSVYRLWGTNMTRFYGRDLTNRRMREFAGELFPPEGFDLLGSLTGTHNFRISQGYAKWQSTEPGRFSENYWFIELPLADDGHIVDKYITLAHVVETL